MVVQRRWLAGVSASVILAASLTAFGQAKQDPKSLWQDFNHYVRVARPDMAAATGNSLLALYPEGKDGNRQLLEVVENAGDYADFEATLERASRVEKLKPIADKVMSRLQAARVERSKEPERIVADIKRLGEGERAYANALARLRAAGPYATPEFLKALADKENARLHPYIMQAMVSIGRPLIYPLSESLNQLEPVTQSQVAQVLADIGYPLSLPYIKRSIENPATDPAAKQILQAAFDRISAPLNHVPGNATASELFLTLAENYYKASTIGAAAPGVESSAGTENGIIWEYDRTAGLVPIPVPKAIYGDVLAMRASRAALELNRQLDRALSLWLMANLRRENRLNGGTDLSYSSKWQAPMFYVEMAGPSRIHDILEGALNDNDPVLALDAIDALSKTAGTAALVNKEGGVQPLLRCLSYPDRRVRFTAAFALCNARPTALFPGANRIVPVLTEAVRQGDVKYALVIGRDTEDANKLAAVATDMGYQVVAGDSLDAIAPQMATIPGVDIVLVHKDLTNLLRTKQRFNADYKLAGVPVIALVEEGQKPEVTRSTKNLGTVLVMNETSKPEEIKTAAEGALKALAGRQITGEEAEVFATRALGILYEIGSDRASIFKVSEARNALVEALNDPREKVAIKAGEVLALQDDPEVQRALGNAALDPARPTEQRLALLGSLATNARSYGNRLSELQVDKLMQLIKSSTGDLAIAAARVHGALTLPTSDVVELIAVPQAKAQ